MAPLLRASLALRNAMLTMVRNALDEGSVDILFGELPASTDESLFGQLLIATLQLATPAGPVPSGGTFELTSVAAGEVTSAFEPPPPDPGAEVQPVLFARFFDAAGVAQLDVDVGLPDSDATLKVSTTTFVLGESVEADTWILSF